MYKQAIIVRNDLKMGKGKIEYNFIDEFHNKLI